MRTIVSSVSARRQLDQLARFRIHLVGLYHSVVGSEWSSHGALESDYLHHIEIALAGRRQVVFLGEVLKIDPGNAYWFPGNTPLERCCRERCEVIFMKLRCEWLPGVDPLLDWPGRRPALVGPCQPDYWRGWLDRKHEPTVSRLLGLQARIMEAIATVVPDLSEVISNHLQTHAHFRDVFAVIEDALGADLRVENLARIHGTGLHAFSMAFRRGTGMSPKAYLARRLNQEAIQMLTNTNLKIKEVADRLRFGDEYHFNRFFSKANGVPPGRYRQELMRD